MSSSRNQPSAGHEASAPSAAHTPVTLTLDLQDQMDEQGRPRSFFLKETWGSTVADGVPVEFFRSLNGMHVEIGFELGGRRRSCRVGLQPALEACIAAAIAAATGNTASQSGPLAEGDKSREDQ